jgi:hypothetical protein
MRIVIHGKHYVRYPKAYLGRETYEPCPWFGGCGGKSDTESAFP